MNQLRKVMVHNDVSGPVVIIIVVGAALLLERPQTSPDSLPLP